VLCQQCLPRSAGGAWQVVFAVTQSLVNADQRNTVSAVPSQHLKHNAGAAALKPYLSHTAGHCTMLQLVAASIAPGESC